MAQINLSFPDETYSSGNKPSADTLKSDLAAIETAVNANDTASLNKDGTTAMSGDLDMGGQKITNLGTPTAANHAATMGAVYPVGSVFLGVVATNPATLLGFGTWARVAEGKMLIGQDTSDADFDTAEETGGNKEVTITEEQMPEHSHTVNPPSTTTSSNGAHTHTYKKTITGNDYGDVNFRNENNDGRHIDTATSSAGAHTHTLDIAEFDSGNTGTGDAVDIMNPYFVVYMWKRTA